jgi:hypothetical protein
MALWVLGNMDEQETARYLLLAPFHAPNGELIDAGCHICHDGEPNHFMQPLNPSAVAAHAAFLAKCEELPRASKFLRVSV